MKSDPRPLDRFSLVNTSNPEKARAALMRIYAKPKFELLSRNHTLRAVVNHCQLRDIGMSYGSYGADLRMQFPETSYASQIFPIGGKSEALLDRTSFTIGPDRSVVISPHEALTVTNNAEYQRLVLSVNAETLASKLAAITGVACSGSLKFYPLPNYGLPAVTALRNHFLFLVDKVNCLNGSIPEFVLTEFEQTLIVMFLNANRHSYSHLLERPSAAAAFRQIRLTEEYIEANWKRAITLEDLAQVTGVSTLSLVQAFRQRRGYSPMEFANWRRLVHARELLRRPDPTTKVNEVASACGFADLDRFARDYVRAFGERPSHTLGRNKSSNPREHEESFY